METDIYLHTDIKKGRIDLYSYPSEKEIHLHDYLDYILSHIGKNVNVTVNVYGLGYMKDLIFNILYKSGYHPIDTTRKDDMYVKDFRYAIARKKCYYIQVKVKTRSFITLQNVENIIGTEDLTLSGKEIFELFYSVKEFFLKGQKRQNRILYTIAGMSRNLFTRINPSYSKTFGMMKGWNKKINGKPMNVFLEEYCRPSVRGGFLFDTYEGMKYHGPGIGLDCNSIYPYVGCTQDLPTTSFICAKNGAPRYTRYDKYYYIYKLDVYDIKCTGIPCICRDRCLTGADYITDMPARVVKYPDGSKKTKHSKISLTLTQVDLKLLDENYTWYKMEIKSYLVFLKSNTQFKKYYRMLYEYKKNSTGIKRNVPKLFMNSFASGFARRIYTKKDVLKEGDDGLLHTRTEFITREDYEKEKLKVSGLCYISAAIYSAARYYIIKMIKSIPDWQDRWLYSDTDSIYLKGKEIPKCITISDDMGAFKVEHEFRQCTFYGNKQYILDSEKEGIVYKLAGVPKLSRMLLEEPQEWIYSKPHTRWYMKLIQKDLKHKKYNALLSRTIPLLYIDVDYVSEEISYRVEWQKISKTEEPKKEKAVYSDFHRLDEKTRSDQDMYLDIAIRRFNELPSYVRCNGIDEAAVILKTILTKDLTGKQLLDEYV